MKSTALSTNSSIVRRKVEFRSARHTNNLEAIKAFYVQILGLEVLGEFVNHDGYDGIFLGLKGNDWHLEFTSNKENATHNQDPDDILVFYPENEDQFNSIISNIEKRNLDILSPRNPYWADNGILISDPDGFNLIISPRRIVQ